MNAQRWLMAFLSATVLGAAIVYFRNKFREIDWKDYAMIAGLVILMLVTLCALFFAFLLITGIVKIQG